MRLATRVAYWGCCTWRAPLFAKCEIGARRCVRTKRNAGARTHSKNFGKTKPGCPPIFREGLWQCDACSHRFPYKAFHFVFFFWFVAFALVLFATESGTRSFCP